MHTQIFQTDRFIEVTTRKEGIHCYPEAGTSPELKDVSFLAHPHRHIFHFRLKVSVDHNNRDIEFIQLKRWLESNLDEGYLNHKSCEMLAEGIICKVHEAYPKVRFIEVGVSEDGENGAVLSTSYDIDRSVVSEPVVIEDSCDARLNIEVKGTQTSSLAEKVLDSLEVDHKILASSDSLNSNRPKDTRLFLGTEVEGANLGMRTLFVGGDVGYEYIKKVLSSHKIDQIYFGANFLTYINVKTLTEVLTTFPDHIVTVEVDSFPQSLSNLFCPHKNLQVMYRLLDSDNKNVKGLEDIVNFKNRNHSTDMISQLGNRIQIKVEFSFGVLVSTLASFLYSSFDCYGLDVDIPMDDTSND